MAPFEGFTKLGKAGGCATSQTEAIGRLISTALRSGIVLEDLIKQLRGIQCNVPCGDIASCADAIGQSMQEMLTDIEERRKKRDG